jgi:hypothetical protein
MGVFVYGQKKTPTLSGVSFERIDNQLFHGFVNKVANTNKCQCVMHINTSEPIRTLDVEKSTHKIEF